MTADRPAEPDLEALAAELLADVLADPTGALAPSVYETGRLVSLAPWLDGHAARVRFLLDQQHPDGSWAGPDGYALVPTLSATEALLAVLDADAAARPAHAERAELAAAAQRGLAAAAGLCGNPAPSTVVFFMIIPALVADINARLAAAGHCADPLPLPPGLSEAPLTALRAEAWRNPLAGHYLEIVGPVAVGAKEMEPVDGVIGCSAAATAAWLGPDRPSDPDDPSVRFLAGAQARGAGTVPAMTSLVHYERAWIVGNLATAGFDLAPLAVLAAELPQDVGRLGAPTAPGFAHEAETTAIVLSALSALGRPEAPEYLWQYDAGTHFMSTIPEYQPSTTTNAHVLEAFGCYAALGTEDAARHHEAVGRIAAWLGERQEADGSWSDKWHASPYFATMRCALALHRYGGPGHREQVRRAVGWVLDGQRADGSWGRWEGTAEETAYAMRILLDTLDGGGGQDAAVREAAVRGRDFLLAYGLRKSHSTLWIGKELYVPSHLVRAAAIGALNAFRLR
ncbi:prenyltransferase/squalene oxidase repeat-containing protein [Kitasatospora sp. NPDC092286]|uniref:prenyltransferase/squalene oxidase repeat-containing protein n=1 Tax=Kitasatospora sp. NPDC092286 TaxID=3364087 RepID=UPI00381CB03A